MTRRPVGQNRRVTRDQPSRERYLVRHDYGMGALWWWITAASAAEVTTTFAEVEVIDDPTTVRAVESWSLDELDIADAISGPLAELYIGPDGTSRSIGNVRPRPACSHASESPASAAIRYVRSDRTGPRGGRSPRSTSTSASDRASAPRDPSQRTFRPRPRATSTSSITLRDRSI